MDITPFLLGTVMAFSFGTSDFLSKGVTGKIGPYRTTVYILTISGLGALLPALVLKSSLGISTFFALVLVLIATTTFLSFASLYRAYNRGMLSLTAPIVNSFPAFSVLISLVFFGVTFSFGAILALAVIIVGIVLVSTSLSDLRRRISSRRQPLSPGVGSAFLASVFFGVSWAAFGYATQHIGYVLPAIAVRLGGAAVGVALIPVIKPRFPQPSGGWVRTVLVMALLETVGLVIFSLGVTIAPSPSTIPILATFGGISAAFTVSYAIVLLKERLEINHVVGVILLIAGVVTLLYLTS
ncbi:MAG: DMT family transporter [Nitrososphaerales archaeon]